MFLIWGACVCVCVCVLYIFVKDGLTWNPKQPFINGCLVKQTYTKIWNHPIETAIYKWLFGVPGMMVSIRFVLRLPCSTFGSPKSFGARQGCSEKIGEGWTCGWFSKLLACWMLGIGGMGTTLHETKSSPLKINGWKMFFLGGEGPILACYVSFRDGKSSSFLSSVNAARNFEIMLRRILKDSCNRLLIDFGQLW